MKNVSITTTLVLLFGAPGWAQDDQPIYGYDAEAPVEAELADLNPNPMDAPWFESWDVVLWTDDGTFIHHQFLTSTFGFGIELSGTARILVVDSTGYNDGSDNPDGVARGDRGFQGRDGDWDWDRDEPFDIFFRDTYLRGNGENWELYMRSRDRDVFFEAEMTSELPLWTPGDGRLEYGWDRHQRYLQQIVPRFSWTGRLNLKDNEEAPDNWVDVSGVGMISHTRLNTFPNEYADAFRRFRVYREDGLSIVMQSIDLPSGFEDEQVGWLMVGLDGEIIFESSDVRLVPADVRSEERDGRIYDVPYTYDVVAVSGDDQVVISLSNPDMVSSENALRALSPMLRRILGGMMSPQDFEVTADYTAYITVDGDTAQVSGRGWSSTSIPIGRTR